MNAQFFHCPKKILGLKSGLSEDGQSKMLTMAATEVPLRGCWLKTSRHSHHCSLGSKWQGRCQCLMCQYEKITLILHSAVMESSSMVNIQGPRKQSWLLHHRPLCLGDSAWSSSQNATFSEGPPNLKEPHSHCITLFQLSVLCKIYLFTCLLPHHQLQESRDLVCFFHCCTPGT